MAKDGTIRGGKRQGAGRKPADLATKIMTGAEASVLKFPEMPNPTDLEGVDMPKVDDWLKEQQQDGQEWQAEKIVKYVYAWLKQRNCEQYVTIQQIYTYATAQSRWIQCQRAISKYGFLAKHPTTSAPIESPYVKIAEKFNRQAAAAWYAIFTIVKENSTEAYNGMNPHEAIMASLLTD